MCRGIKKSWLRQRVIRRKPVAGPSRRHFVLWQRLRALPRPQGVHPKLLSAAPRRFHTARLRYRQCMDIKEAPWRTTPQSRVERLRRPIRRPSRETSSMHSGKGNDRPMLRRLPSRRRLSALMIRVKEYRTSGCRGLLWKATLPSRGLLKVERHYRRTIIRRNMPKTWRGPLEHFRRRHRHLRPFMYPNPMQPLPRRCSNRAHLRCRSREKRRRSLLRRLPNSV